MLIDYILIAIAFVWLVFAAIYDFKTREVPDWLSYSFIAIALAIKLIYSIITKAPTIIIFSLIGLAIFGIVGIVLYYLRQWGGGDAKLFMGMGAMFPIYPFVLTKLLNPNLSTPFLLILFINIMFFGAIYGIFYIIVLSFKNRNKLRKINFKPNKYRYLIIIISILLLILAILTKDVKLKILVLIVAALIIILPKLTVLINTVERNFMRKLIPINKLTEGDWIVNDIKARGKIVYSSKSLGIKKEEIEQLKKYKIRKVVVKYGIPFTITFLIGLIISLLFGNILIPVF